MIGSYDGLCAPFSEKETFTLAKGGKDFTYVTAEAVTTRLNLVADVDGWEFDVVEHGSDESHAWVLGRLTLHFTDRSISRSQFGECGRNPGMGLGDARKGACSDALKKCASLFGVGLYLSHKEEQAPGEQALSRRWRTDGTELPTVPGEVFTCEVCGEEMRDTIRKDGSVWLASEKAAYSQKQYHGRILCYSCSRNAG